MALYTRSRELAINVNLFGGGFGIYVNNSTGSDVTGDGSLGNPYSTIARGAMDIVSGRGDTLWIVATGTPYVTATVTFTATTGFAIRGIGKPEIATSGNSVPLLQTSITRMGANVCEVDFGAVAHNLAIGDVCVFNNFDEGGGARVNGCWVVSSLPSGTVARFTRFTNHTTTGSGGGVAPFTGSTFGEVAGPLAFSFVGCQDFYVDGLQFQGADLVGNPIGNVSGIAMSESLSGSFVIGNSNWHVSNCDFTSGIFAYLSRTVDGGTLDIFLPSKTGHVEQCIFSNGYVTGLDNRQGQLPLFMLNGGSDLLVTECIFQHSPILSATQAAGVIRFYQQDPKFQYIFHDCVRGENVDTDELFANQADHSTSGGTRVGITAGKVRFVANNYQGETGQIAIVDTSGPTRDIEAAAFLNQGIIPTRDDLIHGREVEVAASFDGTMGRLDALRAYGGAIHIDTVNGSAGTTLGINGTPDNPVDTLADAITLDADAEFGKYRIRGSITLTTAHTGHVFEGVGAVASSVDCGGQDVDGSTFDSITVVGSIVASTDGVIARDGCVLASVTGFLGSGFDCAVVDVAFAAGQSRLADCTSGDFDGGSTIIDCVAAGRDVNLRDFQGPVTIRNLVGASDTVNVDLIGRLVTVEASCTSGAINLSGIARLADSSAGTTLDLESLFQPDTVADSVWDELRSSHLVEGSFGAAFQGLVSGEFNVVAGGTATTVRTDATQATSTYNSMTFVAVRGAQVASRRIQSYNVTNGAFTLASALPFTPLAGDSVYVLPARVDPSNIALAVWGAARASYNAAGSFGESTRLNATGLATSAAQEIRDEILSDSTPFPGANIDAAISSRAAPGDAMDLVAATLAKLERLFGENARSREFFAAAEIDTLPLPGRFVPVDASSHIEVQIRAEGAADFSSPIATFYIVFGYENDAASTDTPSANTVVGTAPVDGTFTSSTYSAGFPS